MQGFTYTYGDRPLEGYTIQRAAGRGGFGEVYYALSDGGREVALKVVQGYETIELRGISQCMNLKSPHLVTIFDVRYNEQGKPFVIMEYVNGPSLRELIDQSPSGIGGQKAAFFLREIAKGLTYLHDRGIVHRDLKPGNVFYEDGYVKIGDYGLSKAISASRHSGQTITVGTVHYMAPEIGQGRYDRGIDIYALGCMLYEMLTGQTPFLGGSPGEILMKHLVEEADLTNIEEPFAGVIRKALAKDAKDRFQTVQEMVEAVFGAAHIQQSVSCFSPESLTMVAGRVAQKVGQGGPGSSTQVDLGGTQPRTDAARGQGDFVDRLGQRIDRLGERVVRVGERIGRKLEQAGQRIDARLGGQPEAPPVVPPLAPAVDPRRDPLRVPEKVFLAVVTAGLISLGTALFSSNGWGGVFWLTWDAAYLVIMGGMSGLAGVQKYLAPYMKQESKLVRRLAYGGAACLLAGLMSLFAFALDGPSQRIMGTHYLGGTALSLAVSLLLTNWWRIVSPARPQRISLDHAISASILGMVAAFVFGANVPFVIGVLAGISLTAQALSPWDPLAVRPPKRSKKVRFEMDSRVDRQHGQTPDPTVQREYPAQRQANIPAGWQTPPGSRMPAQTVRPLPGTLRVGMLVLAIGLLATAIGTLSAVVAGAVSRSDRLPTLLVGAVSLPLSVWLLRLVSRGVFVNAWTTIVRPVLKVACLGSIVGSICAMVGVFSRGRLSSDDLAIAIFFIVFPAILLFVLAKLPEGLFEQGGGARRRRGPGWRLRRGPDGRPILPPGISNHKRAIALPLAVAGWFTGLAGLHRFYTGKIGTGLLWLITWGFLGVGQLIDVILIATGQFTDRQGRRLEMWTDPSDLEDDWPAGPAPVPPPPAEPMEPAGLTAADPQVPPPGQYPPPQADAPSWRSQSWISRRPAWVNPTNPLLAFLSGLLMVVSLLSSLLGTLSRPALVVMATFDPSLARQAWYESFLQGNWQGVLGPLEVALSTALMLLAIIVLILARRWAGGAHMVRAIIGPAGMLLSLHMFGLALNLETIDWANTVSLVQYGYVQEGVKEVLEHTHAGGMILAGLLMLGSVVILAWPPRRPEMLPPAGQGV